MKQNILTTNELETLHDELYKNADMYEAYINDLRDDIKKWRKELKSLSLIESERQEIEGIINDKSEKLKEQRKALKKLLTICEKLYQFYY